MEKYCRAGQATDENMAHSNWMLDTKGYKHTLGVCNAHCFSSASIVAQTPLIVTLYVHCLSCWKSVERLLKNARFIVLYNKSVNCQDWIASVIEERVCSTGGMILRGQTEVLGEKRVLTPLYPSQISNGLTLDRTWFPAVVGMRYTAWIIFTSWSC